MLDNQRIKERFKLVRPVLLPLILHVALLSFSLNWIEAYPEYEWNYFIALSPMLPGIFIALGVVKAIRQLDELERKTLYEGLAFSFLVTFLFVTSLGMLEKSGFQGLNGTLIGLLMIVLWLIGKLWAMKKYHEE